MGPHLSILGRNEHRSERRSQGTRVTCVIHEMLTYDHSHECSGLDECVR